MLSYVDVNCVGHCTFASNQGSILNWIYRNKTFKATMDFSLLVIESILQYKYTTFYSKSSSLENVVSCYICKHIKIHNSNIL